MERKVTFNHEAEQFGESILLDGKPIKEYDPTEVPDDLQLAITLALEPIETDEILAKALAFALLENDKKSQAVEKVYNVVKNMSDKDKLFLKTILNEYAKKKHAKPVDKIADITKEIAKYIEENLDEPEDITAFLMTIVTHLFYSVTEALSIASDKPKKEITKYLLEKLKEALDYEDKINKANLN